MMLMDNERFAPSFQMQNFKWTIWYDLSWRLLRSIISFTTFLSIGRLLSIHCFEFLPEIHRNGREHGRKKDIQSFGLRFARPTNGQRAF
jgi:hypothetical protein